MFRPANALDEGMGYEMISTQAIRETNVPTVYSHSWLVNSYFNFCIFRLTGREIGKDFYQGDGKVSVSYLNLREFPFTILACKPIALMITNLRDGFVTPRCIKIPLSPPFSKGDNIPSLLQREVGRDLRKLFFK